METWFIMEDGSYGDPREISPQKDGVLRDKKGMAVAMRAELADPVPRTVEVDPEEVRAKAKPKAREMNAAEQRPGYTTRESRSR